MLINDWMSKAIITIDVNSSLRDALKLFETKMVSLLPVLDNGKLAGIVTDGDIKKASPSAATTLDKYEIISLTSTVKVKSIMTKDVITIHADHTIDEAAQLMLKKKIFGMPVVDSSGRIDGIITKSDIFKCFISFTGVASKGQILAFKLKDKPGVIKNLTDIIRKNEGRLRSILTSWDDSDSEYRKVFIHLFDIDTEKFRSISEKFHKTGELLYAVDLTNETRRIY